MATIPPRFRNAIPRTLRDMFSAREVVAVEPLSPHESNVADWLRGDVVRHDTLVALLKARYDRRAALPVPSTAHDLAISSGAQKELLDVINWLGELYKSPVAGSDESDDV